MTQSIAIDTNIQSITIDTIRTIFPRHSSSQLQPIHSKLLFSIVVGIQLGLTEWCERYLGKWMFRLGCWTTEVDMLSDHLEMRLIVRSN